MSGHNEHDDEDKPTVVLDLNALKKEKQKQEEEAADLAATLEFAVNLDDEAAPTPSKISLKVILFDFNSDFFARSLKSFPQGHDYHVVTTLAELNKHLKEKKFQIVVFNYDVNAKATNQLCAQIKQKLPRTKTLIMAEAISPQKAAQHAATSSGANGYYKLPLDAKKIEDEFSKIHSLAKAA